jgi:hypothetical protein
MTVMFVARCQEFTPTRVPHLRCGLDHRQDASADRLGQPVPSPNDGGQVRVILTSVGGNRVGNGRGCNPQVVVTGLLT